MVLQMQSCLLVCVLPAGTSHAVVEQCVCVLPGAALGAVVEQCVGVAARPDCLAFSDTQS